MVCFFFFLIFNFNINGLINFILEIIEKVHNILKEANGLEVFKLALNDETKSIRIKQLIIQTLFVITSSSKKLL